MDLLHLKRIVEGERIILRPFSIPGDQKAIKHLLTDSEVLHYTCTDSVDEWNKVFAWYKRNETCSTRLDYAIIDAQTNQLIGELVLNDLDEQRASMNVRIAIAHSGRGSGLGQEALELGIATLFTHSLIQELTLTVYRFNKRALHVYEKLGFVMTDQDDDEIFMRLRRC